jgi:hypothetical protein
MYTFKIHIDEEINTDDTLPVHENSVDVDHMRIS